MTCLGVHGLKKPIYISFLAPLATLLWDKNIPDEVVRGLLPHPYMEGSGGVHRVQI